MRRRLAWVLALGLLASGCGGDGSRGGATDEAALLRLSPEPGATQSLRMTMDMSMAMSFGETEAPSVDMPSIATTIDTTVDDVGEHIDVSYVYRDVEASGGHPQATQQIQHALGGMEGMRGTASFTDRGELADASVEAPAAMDPMLVSLLDQMEQQLGQMTVPFPEEPVAVGDSWEASTSFELSGITTTMDARYTLRELDGDAYTIDVEYTQTISPGPIEGPNGEVVGEVLGGQGRGSGRMSGDLGFPLPDRVTMNASSTSRSRIQGAPGGEELSQDVELVVRIEPAG